MKVLLTGFEPFGELKINPSQLIVQHIAEHAVLYKRSDIITEILQTEFNTAEVRIQELIHQTQPDAIICLGVAMGIGAIQLERVALNLDESRAPGNVGMTMDARSIISDGPLAYLSTLPLNSIREVLQDNHIPVYISNHAGTYVCNHVFYIARHASEKLPNKPKCGFIHVPLMTEQFMELSPYTPHLPLGMMIRAVEDCIEVLREDSEYPLSG